MAGWNYVNVNVNAWTPRARFGFKRKLYLQIGISKSLVLSHAEVVQGVRKCQPCFIVPCALQPRPELLVATKSCDLLIPHMPWPTYLSSSDGWIPSQPPTYPCAITSLQDNRLGKSQQSSDHTLQTSSRVGNCDCSVGPVVVP